MGIGIRIRFTRRGGLPERLGVGDESAEDKECFGAKLCAERSEIVHILMKHERNEPSEPNELDGLVQSGFLPSEAKKTKNRAITGLIVTPSYRGFRSYRLDTVAGWGGRIFLREEVVQGRSRSGVIARQFEISKKAIKGESTKSTVTPTHNAV